VPLKQNPNLKDFWLDKNDNLRRVRYRILYGGRASSKSHEIATMLVKISFKYKVRILCTRAFQTRIKESVYSLIEQKVGGLWLTPYFTFKRAEISNVIGSSFIFLGLSRNMDEIKGLEDIDIVWIEEGQYITKEMFDY
jgi:phage terminase large subunit